MHHEHPLKKKYNPKCVPVRRVSAWEHEQIEKRQRHLKAFKGQKWQKLHREDELRKAKAAAAGVRYVRLSSVRSSSSIAPNKVARVSAAKGTRSVRFTARKKDPHKPRKHLTHQSTKKTSTNNKISPSTYRPRPKKYRYKKESPPPTPLTLQNIKKFRMEERNKRKGRGYDYDDFENDAAADAVSRLHKLISEDANSVALIRGVRFIQRLRKNAPPQKTNPSLEHAEKVLFQIINQGYDISDIRLQSDKVQKLSGALRPTAPRLADEDFSERRKPAETELGQEATIGPSQAPVTDTKGAPERSKPNKPNHGHRRAPADSSTAPVPAEEDIRERSKPDKPDHGKGREATASPPAPAPAARDTPERTRPTQADHGSRQENRRAEAPLDASSRHKQPPKARAPASPVGDHLDPPSPVLQVRQPAPAPKPVHTQSHEKKRPEAPLDTTTAHKQSPKSQAPVSSAGDLLDAPPPPRPAEQPLPESKPAPVQRQQDKRTEETLEASTRANQPPKSIASASSIGEPLTAPSPPQRAFHTAPLPRPSPLHRQQTAPPSTAPEATTRLSKRPQSNVSTSSLASRFDRPSSPQRGRQPAPLPRPSQLQQQQNARPSTAPGPSARPPLRPQSSASVSSHASSFAVPFSPARSRQPAPLPPQPQRQQQPARPSTAPASSASTNKRPRYSASVSSRTSSFAAPRSPPRGRQRANSAASPPPPKRRRARTPTSPDHYPPSDSPSPPPPRPPGIPPRPRFKAMTSITDREDRASRAIMHPASEPLAKLSDFEKMMTQDFDRIGMGRRQTAHPTFRKAREMGNVNFKHVRHVNRAGGRRVERVVERSVFDRIGMPPGLGRGVPQVGQAGQVGARGVGGGGGAGMARAGSAGPSEAARGRPQSRGESVGGGNEQTVEELIAAQYGCSEAGGDEEML